MATLYKDIYNPFLERISDTDILSFTETDRKSILHGLMVRACTKFERFCTVDLQDRDDIQEQFNNDLNDEIIDIITTGMVVEWIKPKYFFNENLQNVLNTKDYNMYSPANLLNQIRETYLEVKKEYENMVNKYSYYYGDIRNLQ